MSERKRHYSGNHSKRFWTRVGKITNDTEHASSLEQAEIMNATKLSQRRAGEK